MKFCLRTIVLASTLGGWATGAAAQDECQDKINAIAKGPDVVAALSCLNKRIASEHERVGKEAEAKSSQTVQQQLGNLEVVTTNAKNVSLKDATTGIWKAVPESEGANACYVSSVRLPPQGLCQVAYQGALERWAYNISDPAMPGFLCTATCVWLKVLRQPQTAKD